MKKIISTLLICCLFLSCVGCSSQSDPEEEHILFYYPRISTQYEYGSTDGIISWEERDPAGHRNNLRYLLTLYLLGPVDDHLTSPFPEGCQILDLVQNDAELVLTLNSAISTLKEMDLTLACVSLAETCFGLSQAQTVRIISESDSGEIIVDETITRQQLLIEDAPLPSETSK